MTLNASIPSLQSYSTGFSYFSSFMEEKTYKLDILNVVLAQELRIFFHLPI